jgi:hypothetical protein
MPRTRTKLKYLMLRGRTYYLKVAIPKDIQLATGNGRYLGGKIISVRTVED